MTEHTWWHEELRPGEGPLVALAPYAGSRLDDALVPYLSDEALAAHWQLHAPWTAPMTAVAPTRLWARRSRFELDLDAPRDEAVGRAHLRVDGGPTLRLWRREPPRAMVDRGLAGWDAFYAHLERVFDALLALHGRFVALVLRAPYVQVENAPGFDPRMTPELVLQTGSVDRLAHGQLLERFGEQLGHGVVLGYPLVVQEEALHAGGHLASWINHRYAGLGCALAVELRTVVVDDASGMPERFAHAQITDHLRQALRGAMELLAPEPTAPTAPGVPRQFAPRM